MLTVNPRCVRDAEDVAANAVAGLVNRYGKAAVKCGCRDCRRRDTATRQWAEAISAPANHYVVWMPEGEASGNISPSCASPPGGIAR